MTDEAAVLLHRQQITWQAERIKRADTYFLGSVYRRFML